MAARSLGVSRARGGAGWPHHAAPLVKLVPFREEVRGFADGDRRAARRLRNRFIAVR